MESPCDLDSRKRDNATKVPVRTFLDIRGGDYLVKSSDIREQAKAKRDLAARTRRWANGLVSAADVERLKKHAEDLEREAAELERQAEPEVPATPPQVPATPPRSRTVMQMQQQQQQQRQQQTDPMPPESKDEDRKP